MRLGQQGLGQCQLLAAGEKCKIAESHTLVKDKILQAFTISDNSDPNITYIWNWNTGSRVVAQIMQNVTVNPLYSICPSFKIAWYKRSQNITWDQTLIQSKRKKEVLKEYIAWSKQTNIVRNHEEMVLNHQTLQNQLACMKTKVEQISLMKKLRIKWHTALASLYSSTALWEAYENLTSGPSSGTM